MERPPILTAPIIASDTWFAEGSAVIDAKVTESSQEWTELMQLHKKAQSGGPPIERARLKLALARGGGVPMDMRAEVWFTFSGAADRMAQHPTVYDQLCKRVAAFHEASAAAGGAPSASENDAPSRISTTEQTAYRVLEQVEKDLRRTEVGSDGDKLSAMRRVLCAFASFNPDVGYVQGMNFIVVALLRVFDEQQTFWMLALIVQVRGTRCVFSRLAHHSVPLSLSTGLAARALLLHNGWQSHRLPRPCLSHLRAPTQARRTFGRIGCLRPAADDPLVPLPLVVRPTAQGIA